MLNMLKRGYQAVKGAAKRGYESAKGVAAAVTGAVAGVLGLSAPKESYAAGPDLTTLTTAVDFGTVTTALLGVAAALIVVYIAWKGAKMVLAAVRGG